jgi:hypothetical protein
VDFEYSRSSDRVSANQQIFNVVRIEQLQGLSLKSLAKSVGIAIEGPSQEFQRAVAPQLVATTSTQQRRPDHQARNGELRAVQPELADTPRRHMRFSLPLNEFVLYPDAVQVDMAKIPDSGRSRTNGAWLRHGPLTATC